MLSEDLFVTDWTPFLVRQPLIKTVLVVLMAALQDLYFVLRAKLVHANHAVASFCLSPAPEERF